MMLQKLSKSALAFLLGASSVIMLLSNLSLSQEPQAKPAKPAASAKPSNGLVTYINPETMFESDTYSKAVVVNGPVKTVYISGCIPIDKAFKLVGGADLRAQLRAALKNLGLVMDGAGLTKDDIVKVSVSLVYKEARDTFITAEELQSFFERDEMPATTISGSAYIIADGIRVQIEAIGVTKG